MKKILIKVTWSEHLLMNQAFVYNLYLLLKFPLVSVQRGLKSKRVQWSVSASSYFSPIASKWIINCFCLFKKYNYNSGHHCNPVRDHFFGLMLSHMQFEDEPKVPETSSARFISFFLFFFCRYEFSFIIGNVFLI